MDEQTPNYRGEFFKSPHHAALGRLTLGLGFLSAELLPAHRRRDALRAGLDLSSGS